MTLTGYPDLTRNDLCNCCKRRVHKIPFTVWTNVDDFAAFGVGYSLYYKTLIYIMYFLAVQLGVVIFVVSATDMPTTRPHQNVAFDNYLFFAYLFFVYWLRFKIMKYYEYLTTKIPPNIAEFSVALSGLPQDANLLKLEEDLRERFETLNHYNGIDHPVQQVTFFFRTNDYLRLEGQLDGVRSRLLYLNERDEMWESREEEVERGRLRREKKDRVQKEIFELETKMEQIETELREALTEGRVTDRFTGKAMVVFKTQLAAYDILNKYNVENPILYRWLKRVSVWINQALGRNPEADLNPLVRPLVRNEHFVDRDQIIVFHQSQHMDLSFKDEKVYVIKAVNPGNILWHHFGYSYYRKVILRALFFGFSLLILGLSFVLVRTINNARFQYFRDNPMSPFLKFMFSSCISLSILTFNNLLNQFIIHTIQFEWHEKRTNELSSMINKIILKMFLNTTVMIFLICFNGGSFDASFLAYQTHLMAGITASLSPLAGFWDFTYFLRLYRRYRASRADKIKETQAYLSKIWENPEYNIVLNYSGFIFHFLNLAVYINFFPFWLSLLILIYYCYNFTLQKWLFVRRNSVLNPFRNELNIAVLNLIDFAPLLVLVAQHLRNLVVFGQDDRSWFFWVKAALAAWTVFFPNDRMVDYLFLRRSRNFGHYDTYREIFKDWNYTKNNPAYTMIRKQRGMQW